MGGSQSRPRLAGMAHPSPEPTWQQPDFRSGPAPIQDPAPHSVQFPPPVPNPALQYAPPVANPAWTVPPPIPPAPIERRFPLARRLIWPFIVMLVLAAGSYGVWIVVAIVLYFVFKRQQRERARQDSLAYQALPTPYGQQYPAPLTSYPHPYPAPQPAYPPPPAAPAGYLGQDRLPSNQDLR